MISPKREFERFVLLFLDQNADHSRRRYLENSSLNWKFYNYSSPSTYFTLAPTVHSNTRLNTYLNSLTMCRAHLIRPLNSFANYVNIRSTLSLRYFVLFLSILYTNGGRAHNSIVNNSSNFIFSILATLTKNSGDRYSRWQLKPKSCLSLQYYLSTHMPAHSSLRYVNVQWIDYHSR